ncbi:MAG: glycoside hydrolase family 32 protein [Bryobacteraceae bacterium]
MKRIHFLIAALAGVALCAGLDFREPYRPQFHFSPRRNWTNDPNGLVYDRGRFHAFFQFNPFGDEWGHMSWGHAVSDDAVRWRELPVAIPEAGGIMIFTGSAVVDTRNTSGFCLAARPCLVAVYTGHSEKLQTQNVAYSNDDGLTWTKYSANPVLNLDLADFRDPNVFWLDSAGAWIMVVALPPKHRVLFYQSADLKHWKEAGGFGPAGATGGVWECPDLFQAPMENGGERKWVLKVGLNPGHVSGGSGEQYFVGSFDGARFTPEPAGAPGPRWTDYGRDCYCALTWNGLPAGTLPLILGWMDNWQYAANTPTSPWRGQMTLPRSVSLRRTAPGISLLQKPAPALESLRTGHLSHSGTSLESANAFLNRVRPFGDSLELSATLDAGSAQEFGLRVLKGDGAATVIGYDRATSTIFLDRTRSGEVGFSPAFPSRSVAPLALASGSLQLHLFVDKSSVEVFAGDGEVTFTDLVYPRPKATSVEVYGNGGNIARIRIEAWQLRSIW